MKAQWLFNMFAAGAISFLAWQVLDLKRRVDAWFELDED
jgi:hypothetical protein